MCSNLITAEIDTSLNGPATLFVPMGEDSSRQYQHKPVSGSELAQSPDRDDKDLTGIRLLLVEDYLINVKVAMRYLLKWGLVVETAENGLIAVEKYRSGQFDIILMDLEMPIMDGYTAAMEIRKLNTRVPIIALTASGTFSDEARAVAAGMNDYVVKPFAPADLFQKIVRFCL